MTDFWRDKRVCVTGATGFIGKHVVAALIGRGVEHRNLVRIDNSINRDLRFYYNCRNAVEGCDVVIHLAARTGGISYSREHPASQYYASARIDLNVLEACRAAGVGKVVCIGNILAYPADAHSPLEEAYLWDGKLASTHLGVGMAKRNLVGLCEMYHKEYELNAVTVLAANAYGPGDRFDPAVAHVIPATIIKCHKDEPLVVWGDGSQTRDFLYVTDVAEGLLLAAEYFDAGLRYHINLSSGAEVSIEQLVRMIARLCAFNNDIVFDESKGGGDPRRVASGRLARELLGFEPKVGLDEGLWSTIEDYRRQR